MSVVTRNQFRPATFDMVIGQEPAKKLLRAAVTRTQRTGEPMPHMLFVGRSGCGKTTLAHVSGREVGQTVWDVEAPVTLDTLLELREQMQDGDILKIEEVHLQAIQQRRGRAAATEPEVFYSIMEDRLIPTQNGPLAYPLITVVGTTTDEGLLPDAFVNRFPLRPRIVGYTPEQMVLMAARNARSLGLTVGRGGAELLASASRGIPREMNNLVTTVSLFMEKKTHIQEPDVRNVLDLNGITEDGLSPDMQAMLVFLYERGRRVTGDGSLVFQASVNSIATAIGKSRDSKAVTLRVEPYLIERGYIEVAHGGRKLTDAGIVRAYDLVEATP